LADFLDQQAGGQQTPEAKQRLDRMRAKGVQVYDQYFSFFRNPHNIATAYLYEAWVLMQMLVKSQTLDPRCLGG
jgi:hypothetical protein